jgi:hypothetical protein
MQVGAYQLVIDLGEEAQHLGAAALRSSNKDTLRDFERDLTLATALAHCGLAREAFDAGQAGPGCARMEEALRLLRTASTAPGALGVLGAAPPLLAPGLQAEIQQALLELRAEALLGYLQVGDWGLVFFPGCACMGWWAGGRAWQGAAEKPIDFTTALAGGMGCAGLSCAGLS